MSRDQMTGYLHQHFPLTRHLGIRVEEYDGSLLTISAPLKVNSNHRGTAFGGSLSAVAILSGWALLHFRLREEKIANHLVIQKSFFDFVGPVDGDFSAVCALPSPERWERFLRTLRRRGRARVPVRSEICSSSGIRGRHDGVYAGFLG